MSSLLEGLPYQLALWLHISVGSVALVCFWTAAIARKGAGPHRSAGKVFMLAMCVVLVTGIPLTAQRFYVGESVGGLFLGYLFLITGHACWMAWRAVQDKADWRVMVARPLWWYWIVAGLVAGVGVLVAGLRLGNPLLIGFSLIGPLLSLRMWRFALRGPTRSNWHIIQHYRSILGAGIATHVAFLSVGMARVWPLLAKVWPDLPQTLIYMFPWVAPVALALIAQMLLDRRYGRLGRSLPQADAAG